MSTPIEFTIELVNETEFTLTFAETSPQDPQTATLAGRVLGKPPASSKIVVTDRTQGIIDVIACSDFLAAYGLQSSSVANNRPLFTADVNLHNNSVTHTENPHLGAHDFKATIKSLPTTDKEVFYFLALDDKLIDQGVTPGATRYETSDNVDAYVKAVFSTRFFGLQGGSFVRFTWNGQTPQCRKITATQTLTGDVLLTESPCS